MKAVFYTAPREFSVRLVPDPVVGPQEVAIRVQACGVCHTDVNVHQGEFFARFPLIPGHEIAGVVATVGTQVTDLHPGQRVVVDNTWACGQCPACQRGQPLFCQQLASLGINAPGGAAELVKAHEAKVFTLPEGLDWTDAVMVEPLACAVHGADRIGVRAGDAVLIYGAGPAALLLGQLVRNGGASHVVVAAPTPHKLECARALFADAVYLMPRNHPEGAGLPDGAEGFDVVIDTTGSPTVLQEAIRHVRVGGKLVVYGMSPYDGRVSWSPYEIFKREITVIGSFAQMHQFPRALALLAAGRVRTQGIVTAWVPLDEYARALSNVREGGEIKTALGSGASTG